jgi:hypothetical protein
LDWRSDLSLSLKDSVKTTELIVGLSVMAMLLVY